MKRVPKKMNPAISYGDDYERGGDLVAFCRGIPMYFHPYLNDGACWVRVPDKGRPARFLVGRDHADQIRKRARQGAEGFSLPSVFA